MRGEFAGVAPLKNKDHQWGLNLIESHYPWFDRTASSPQILQEKRETQERFHDGVRMRKDAGPVVQALYAKLGTPYLPPTRSGLEYVLGTFEPDIFLMQRMGVNQDPELVAFAAAQTSNWDPHRHFGKPLAHLHANASSGEIPEQIGDQIYIFMTTAKPGKTYDRWGVSFDTQTARDTNPRHMQYEFNLEASIEECFLREEHQGIAVLPIPNEPPDRYGVAFMIRVVYECFTDLVKNPARKEAYKRQILSMTPAARRYKGLDNETMAFVLRMLQ